MSGAYLKHSQLINVNEQHSGFFNFIRMVTYILDWQEIEIQGWYVSHKHIIAVYNIWTLQQLGTVWMDETVHLHVHFHDGSLCHYTLDNLNIIILYSYTDKMYSTVWYVSHLSSLSPVVYVFTVSAVQLGNLANRLDWLCAWVASLKIYHRWVLCAHLLAIWMSLQNWFTGIDGVV